MPFTPYHWGPPLLLIGVLAFVPQYRSHLNNRWYSLSFLVGAVVPDVQGFYSIFFNPSVPIHGFSHTLLGALVYAAISYFGLNFLRSPGSTLSPVSFYLSLFGSIVIFHIIPDMLIWSDMKPFFPLSSTSFGQEERYGTIAEWMTRMFITAIFLFLIRFILTNLTPERRVSD